MHDWVILTTRMGLDIRSPTIDDLKKALEELFSSKDVEHPDASVRCGTDDGPLYSISVFFRQYALYTQYSDVDMSEEVESRKIENVDAAAALSLWLNLIAGRLDQV